MSKKTRKVILWLAILAVAAAAVWFLFVQEKQVIFTEETARTQDIKTFYTFSGNVEPDGAKVYTTMARSSVRKWLVEEGDEVTKDTYVVEYKSGTRVKSPMEGTISDLYLDVDDEFNPGEQLFRVADYAHPKVFIKVDEYDVSALSKGMAVDVKVLSTGKVITGEIVRIAQEATVSGDLAYYAAEIDLPQDGTLAMGLTVEVLVPRESALNATTVSMDAIQYDDNGDPFVYCYNRYDEIIEQSVTLGVNNGTIVEIKDGIKSGETVLIPPSSDFELPMMRMMRNSR